MDPILKTITEVQTINAKLREENERLRNEVARLERLILSSCDGSHGVMAVLSDAKAMSAEARRIRAQREEG